MVARLGEICSRDTLPSSFPGAEDDLTSAHSGVLTLTPTYTQVAALLVHGEAVQGTTAHLLGHRGPPLHVIIIIIIKIIIVLIIIMIMIIIIIMMISAPPALG